VGSQLGHGKRVAAANAAQARVIILSTKANADVDRLYNFLAPKNLDAAIRAMEAIWKKLELVERRPAIGRPTKSPFVRQVKVDFGKRG
jgi:plasmid stabilization system protein ParE